MAPPTDIEDEAERRGRLNQDVVAGVLLVAVGVFVLCATFSLERGSLRLPGPAYFPQAAAAMMALLGVAVVATRGELGVASGWNLRGMVLLTASILVFAATIRSAGFLIAAPLTVLVASFASRETRIVEMLISSGILTVFCLLAFKYALGLPLPLLNLPS
jgi:hypothetical protein